MVHASIYSYIYISAYLYDIMIYCCILLCVPIRIYIYIYIPISGTNVRTDNEVLRNPIYSYILRAPPPAAGP